MKRYELYISVTLLELPEDAAAREKVLGGRKYHSCFMTSEWGYPGELSVRSGRAARELVGMMQKELVDEAMVEQWAKTAEQP